MAKTKIEVDLVINGGDTVGQVEQKTKSLKSELRQMKELLASGTLDSKAFNKLSIEAGELQDRIGDVSQQVRNLSSDAKGLDGFVSVAQGIVGGFAAVQGITALVGDENEELQKTMVKLQGAMAALNGIQALANVLNKTSAASSLLQTVRLRVLNFVEAQRAAALQYTTVAMQRTALAARALGAALAATGIGALLVGITMLIPKIMEWTGATKEQKEAQDKLNESLDVTEEWTNNAIKLNDHYTKLAIEKAKQRGATDLEISAIESKGRQKNIAEMQKQYDLLKNEFDNFNINKFDTAQKAEESYNELSKRMGETYAKIQDMQNAEELSREEAKTKFIQKQADAQKKISDQKVNVKKEEVEKIKEIEQDAQVDAYKRWKEQNDIEQESLMAELERQMEYDAAVDELNKKNAADELKAEQDKKDAKVAILGSYTDAAISAGEAIVGASFKQTAAGKIIALSQIATDTALAISALVKNSQANPANAATSGIAGAVQFAAGIAQITANIASARAILTGGGTPSAGGGSGVGAGASAQAPSTATFIPQAGERKEGVTKVVVLEKDITDVQTRVARIRTNATLM